MKRLFTSVDNRNYDFRISDFKILFDRTSATYAHPHAIRQIRLHKRLGQQIAPSFWYPFENHAEPKATSQNFMNKVISTYHKCVCCWDTKTSTDSFS